MKKTRTVVFSIALCVACALTGCNKKNDDKKKNIPEKVRLTELDVTNKRVKENVKGIANINASEDMRILVPNNVDEIYSYTNRSVTDFNMKEYYDDFVTLFQYLFPDHKMNENFLFYLGGSSSIEYDDEGNIIRNLNKVKDYYNDIISGSEGRVNLLYDETWYKDLTEWNTPVCLEISNPMGYGYGIISKGRFTKITGFKPRDIITGKEEYPRLESFDPADYMQPIASFTPESTESYKLADKEMPINEAVSFFEKYVNNLPYPKEKNCRTVVRSVDVYKFSDTIYGYYFNTNKEYQGIQFDYMKSGTTSSESSGYYEKYYPTMGNGFMIESTDIDIIDGIYLCERAENPTPYTEIISFEKAAEIIGDQLTDEVTFDIQMIELIYASEPARDANGYIDIENQSSKIEPAWKLTLYNTRDQLVYVCYVDAADGGNFRYYRINDSTKLER